MSQRAATNKRQSSSSSASANQARDTSEANTRGSERKLAKGHHHVANGAESKVRRTNTTAMSSKKKLNQQQHQVSHRSSRELAPLARLAAVAANSLDSQHDGYRKQNHCEIEKRRRDKMNNYIMELASVIPSFKNSGSKLDKLSVLRMAVQHVKSMRSSLCSFSSFHLRPSFLSSGNLLKNLILQMASHEAQDSLFMVVTCDRGKVLFVSQSSKDILNQEQDDMVGQCLFDILHKDDVSKVKEQISYFNLMPNEMLVGSKTLQPMRSNQRSSFNQLRNRANSTPQPGARRSFFCRMKSGRSGPNSKVSPLVTSNSESQIGTTMTNETRVAGSQLSQGGDKMNDGANEISKINKNSASSQIIYDKETKTGSKANEHETNKKIEEDTMNKGSDVESNMEINSNEQVSSDESEKNLNNSQKQQLQQSPDSENSSNLDSGIEGVATRKGNSKTSSPSSKNSTGGGKKHWRYNVMHCTGYLKSITLRNDEFDDDDSDEYNSESNSSDDDEENDTYKTVNCLVAVCRRSPMDRDLKPDRPLTFTCRYSMEGKFVFADQRTTVALGYTPQQLLNTSHYAYCHKDSVNTFKECHRQSILKSEPVSSDIYQFKRANGQHLWLQTSLKSFRNPWTKFIDYIVANHTTAEGNEPLYNEGSVPTKFNQDMTSDASQSSSPASSSSLYLSSVDSKKSSSPSSSSMASSYSMESFNSGGSIQALLNQIDRVKSGGIKHSLNFHKKKDDSDSSRSGGSRKSNEDGGNYSAPQSYPLSLSSQDSASPADYLNAQSNINNFTDNGLSNQQRVVDINNPHSGSNHYNPKVNVSRPSHNLSGSTKYQALCQPSTGTVVNASSFDANLNSDQVTRNISKGEQRLSHKIDKPNAGSNKQYNRSYSNQYQYRSQAKSGSPTSSDTGNESAAWSNSSGSVYSNSSSHQSGQRMDTSIREQLSSISKDNQPQRVCNVALQAPSQSAYVMQPNQAQKISIVPSQIPLQGHIDNTENQVNNNYPTQIMNSYMNTNVRYDESVNINQMQQLTNAPQADINITMQLQHQQQIQRIQQSNNSTVMPMVWNASENPYQNLNPMHNNSSAQLCANGNATLMNMDVGNSNNIMIPQQVVRCQQCANHKSSNQQQIMSNNTDLNSINLTSLAVDGDLDEDQLLEYLAGCDPEAQLYNIQNNSFPQCNIYR